MESTSTEPIIQPSKGQRTRDDIVAAAVRLASVRGLEVLSIGMLATETGMSKAGLLAHFGNKQALQLAAVEAARQLVRSHVFEPALQQAPGLPQVREYVRRHLDYIQRRVLPGGCFFTAISVEFDDQDGPVRDSVCQSMAQRDEAVGGMLRRARKLGQLDAGVDVDQLAFELLTMIQGSVVRYLLSRDETILQRAQRAATAMLARADSSNQSGAG
jgi:AcrR family transcriptional regulator